MMSPCALRCCRQEILSIGITIEMNGWIVCSDDREYHSDDHNDDNDGGDDNDDDNDGGDNNDDYDDRDDYI